MAAEFDVSLLLTAPVGDLVLRLRTSTLSALSAALPSAVGLCGAGAGGAVLLFLGVLLEKGAEIGAAELVEYTQAAALAIESPHPEETGPLDLVCRVCAGVAAAATQLGAPGTALDPVTTLIRKALPAHVLTTAHVDFVKLALAARAYNVAAATLDAMPLYAVAQGVTARDALLFHYYSGLVFCGAEAWAHATGMFKTCISLPGPGTSAIQLEAFKKLLLSLAIDPLNIARATGSFHTVPTAVSATLPRHRRDGLSSLARPYVDFAKAIESLDATAARKVVGDHRVVFERDGNAGLAQAAIDGSLPLRQLLLLRRVYSVAPLSVVAKTLGVSGDGVEEVLVRAISRGGLAARIDQSSGAVVFASSESSSEGFDAEDSALAAQLQERVNSSLSLLARLKDADRDLQLSDSFRSRAAVAGKRDARRGFAHFDSSAGGGKGMMGLGDTFSGGGDGDDDDAEMMLARAASMLT